MTSARVDAAAALPSAAASGTVPATRLGRAAWPIMVACVATAAVATWASTHTSLWIDEAYSLDTAGRSWGGTWHQALTFELQPPLYFLLLHAWLRIHPGIIWARALSTIFATTTVAVFGLIGALLWGRRGTWLALVAACSPMLMWAATVSRGYALLLLLTTSSLFFFLRLTVIDTAHPRRDAICYAASSYLALLTAYYSGFLLPGELLAAFLLGRRQGRRVGLALSAVTAAFLPWVPIALMQAVRHPNQNVALTAGHGLADRLATVVHLAVSGAFAQAPAANQSLLLAVTCTVLLAVPLVRLAAPAGRPPVRWTPAETALAIPFGVALVSLLALRFFNVSTVLWRHLTVLVPVTLTLWSLWIVRTRATLRPITGAAAAAVLALMAASRYRNPQVADFHGAADWLTARAKPTDVVFVAGPEVMLTFGYYYGTHSPMFSLPVAISLTHYTPAEFAIRDTAQLVERVRSAPPSPHAWLVLEDYGLDSGRTVSVVRAFVSHHYRTIDARAFQFVHVLEIDPR